MDMDEVIDKLEAETLQLLLSDDEDILKIEVSIELNMELEMRGYYSGHHKTVGNIWRSLPIKVEHHLGQPYRINMERKREKMRYESYMDEKVDEIMEQRYK